MSVEVGGGQRGTKSQNLAKLKDTFGAAPKKGHQYNGPFVQKINSHKTFL